MMTLTFLTSHGYRFQTVLASLTVTLPLQILPAAKVFAASLFAAKHFTNSCIGNDLPVGGPKTNWANLPYFLTAECLGAR